jgi:phosphatidylserine decarboxylase
MPTNGQPIEVFNRTTQRIEHEPVFGERWLRWTYETRAGMLALRVLVRRAVFSRYYGWRMNSRRSARLVAPFIQTYGIDTSEFAQPPESFRSFNEFFARRLKAGARPVAADPRAVVFPADGRHLGFQDIGIAFQIYAKGQYLNVAELLDDAEAGRRFARGTVVISRLCPIDYHRFHFPCEGRVGTSRLLPGPLCSVNPIAVRLSLDHLVRNKRLVTPIESRLCGLVMMVEVGATCVGSIVPTAVEGTVARGDEKGYFRFGGSCVITLFEPGRVVLDDDLLAHTATGRETYAHMGDQLGRVV